jgi:flagellar basal-body rod protein FlgF
MDRLIYSALAGIAEFNHPRFQLNNEIANVSTVGFKRSFVNASRTVKVSGEGFDTRFTPTNVSRDQISLDSGPLMFTGNNTDIAMNNHTVLGVSNSKGELAFTRRGDLRVNNSGVLETGSGQAVRGQNGPISIPPGYAISFTADGSVFALQSGKDTEAPPVLVGRLMLRDASEVKLHRGSDGLFETTAAVDGGERDITNGKYPPSITLQSVEGSNVSPYEAMVRLLEMNRMFESSIKMIKEAKSIDESGASMMKAS